MKDDIWQKMTFDGRQSLIGLPYITWKKYLQLLTLTATAQLNPNRKSYQLSKPEIEFHMMEDMYAALPMCTFAEKTTFFGKDDYHSKMGKCDYGTQSHAAEPYSYLQVWAISIIS